MERRSGLLWRERCARAVSTVLEARPQCSRRFSSLSFLFRIGRSLSAWVSDAAERRGCLAALSRALGLPCSYRQSCIGAWVSIVGVLAKVFLIELNIYSFPFKMLPRILFSTRSNVRVPNNIFYIIFLFECPKHII